MLNKKFLSLAGIALVLGPFIQPKSYGALIDIGTLGTFSNATAISADGSVIIGRSGLSNGDAHAFKYTGVTITDLGTLGGHNSYANAVSANGLVIVGVSSLGNGYEHAYKYEGTIMTDLGTLGGNISGAHSVSADGSVIVGSSTLANGDSHAIKYAGITMTDLGTLGGGLGDVGDAHAISADGSIIVGDDRVGNSFHAFKYDGTTMTDLGTLGGNYSSAFMVSNDGSIIVGISYLANGDSRAFKYVGTTMTNLGTLGGSYAIPMAISANGSVIIGNSTLANGDSHAFKYTGTAMTDLGTLGGTFSSANAISADGSVIVGSSAIPNGYEHAFKFAGTTMTDLGTLGGTFSSANAISADGSVIVGSSTLANGDEHAFIYSNSVMLDPVKWMESISGPAGILPILNSLTYLPMEGAHHRPLMSLDSMGKKTQSWATGDFGSRSRSSDSHTSSGEVGVSSTFGRVMAGLAIGYGEQNNDLLFGGSSHVSGQYILGEADLRLSDNKSIISLTTMFGSWKSNTLRGYVIGGGDIDFSQGSTHLKSMIARIRIDGAVQKIIGGHSIIPFASFTWSRTTADSYDESGGSYDAHFNGQSHVSKEGRVGVSTNFKLGKDTILLTTLEWIHRFDQNESSFSGTDIDHGALPFDVAGAKIHSNQARLGVDVDHKLNPTTMLNFSAHITSVGEAPDVSTSLSLRRAF